MKSAEIWLRNNPLPTFLDKVWTIMKNPLLCELGQKLFFFIIILEQMTPTRSGRISLLNFTALLPDIPQPEKLKKE